MDETPSWSRATLRRADFARRVVGVMSEAVLVVNAELNIVTANDFAFSLFGYSREHLVGASFANLFPQAAMWLVSKLGPTDVAGDEVACERADGQTIPLAIALSILPEDKSKRSYVVVLRDLTAVHRLAAQLSTAKAELTERASDLAIEVDRRRQVEKELREAKDGVERRLEETRRQLLRTERLATLGTLAGGVGHELKNVAMIQQLCVDEARDLVDDGTLDREFLRQLEAVDEHLVNHANRLLNLARPGPDYAEPMDLRAVIMDTLEILDGSGRTKYIPIRTKLPDTPLMVRVNRARIEQILINLVGNAVDAIAGQEEQQIRVMAALSADGERVACEVGDTGPGIAPDKLECIFDPFFTTKPPDRGTGLGLPVVRQIVASYGSELSVYSVVGMGTVFSFDLPTA